MKKNTFVLALSAATIGIACMVASPAWSAGRYDQVQINQQKRIAQGVRSGEITRHELARLKTEQHQIKHFAHHAKADGHVNKWERRQLANMKKQASKHIYTAKHNRMSYNSCRSEWPRHHDGYDSRPRRISSMHNGSFSGAVVQPGLSIAWDVGLH
jgi:hypothetical protein